MLQIIKSSPQVSFSVDKVPGVYVRIVKYHPHILYCNQIQIFTYTNLQRMNLAKYCQPLTPLFVCSLSLTQEVAYEGQFRATEHLHPGTTRLCRIWRSSMF